MIDKNIDDNIIELGLTKHRKDLNIINKQSNMVKEHFKSFAITFVVSCALVLVTQIDDITLATFKDGAYLGILFGVVRAGFKAVLELVIAKFS